MKFAKGVSNLDWQDNDDSDDGSASQPGDPGETIIIVTISATDPSSLWQIVNLSITPSGSRGREL
jgi:hypothetical protein